MAPMNFVLLSFKEENGESPPQIFLNVFIGLNTHYPKKFIAEAEKAGVAIDMEELFDLRYRDSDDQPGLEQKIRDRIYHEFFSENRKYGFYHVLVFKLNLESFGNEEYAMLSHLWGAETATDSFQWSLPYPYSLGTLEMDDFIRAAIERAQMTRGETERRNSA
eukprot:3936402-Rhodomonas_salina.1